MKSLFSALLLFFSSILGFSQTPNDLCSSAQSLSPGAPILIDNSQAIQNEGIWGECWGFGQGEAEQSSVWYTFETPESPTSISIVAYGDGSNTLTDTQFGLFEECGGPMIACDGNSGNGLFSAFNFACDELEPSTSYILMIDGWNGDAGTCFLQMTYGDCGDSLVYGCTDPNALNYNPNANIDDGSCQYDSDCIPASLFLEALQTDIIGYWALSNENGFLLSQEFNDSFLNFEFCLEAGCYNLTLETDTTLLDLIFVGLVVDGLEIEAQWVPTGYISVDFIVGEGCEDEILGCTDPNALNYNPNATVDDGSCVYTNCPEELLVEQVSCNSYLLFLDNLIQDSISGGWFVNGELYSDGASEIWWQATEPGDYEICFYNPNYPTCSELCETIVITEDCLNPCVTDLSFNSYDSCTFTFWAEPASDFSEILWDFGDGTSLMGSGVITYQFANPGVYEVCAQNLNSDCAAVACLTVEVEECSSIYGCTDPNALNYNPNATVNDGTCIYNDCFGQLVVEQYDCNYYFLGVDGNGQNIASGQWTMNGSSLFSGSPFLDWFAPGPGIYEICYSYILPDSSTCEICEQIIVDEGCFAPCIESVQYEQLDSCSYFFYAEPWGQGQEVLWNFGDGSGTVAGPSTIHEFDSTGTFTVCAFYLNADCDGIACTEIVVNSCDEVYGCTDPEAVNYNPLATIDDGSCSYDFGCEIGFTIIPDSTGLNTIWILPQFGNGLPLSILWDFGDGNTSTELYPTHEYDGSGPYQLCVTADLALPNGASCSGTFCAMISEDMLDGAGFTSNGFSLNVLDPDALSAYSETEILGLNIFPNPSSNQLWIDIPSVEDVYLDLNVFDTRGVLLFQERISNNQSALVKEVDISNLAPGTYMLTLKGNTKFATKPFVKVK